MEKEEYVSLVTVPSSQGSKQITHIFLLNALEFSVGGVSRKAVCNKHWQCDKAHEHSG